jgi:hypothetical protein
MIRFSRTLSIALLVVRLMVGCCTHYVHGCESKHISSATHSGATLEGQCPECGCDHSHHGPGECQRPKCSLASPRRPVGGSFSPPLQASFAGLPHAHLPRQAIGLHQQSRTTGHLLLPVRLHLANQVLLI